MNDVTEVSMEGVVAYAETSKILIENSKFFKIKILIESSKFLT
jgi:hypothetical protein